MVLHERERDHEGHQTPAVLVDHLAQLGALVVAELRLKKPARCCSTLVWRARVARTASASMRSARRTIAASRPGREPAAGHQPAEGRVVARAVGKDRELVGGVEGDEIAGPRLAPRERLPARGGEHALDEVLADPAIASGGPPLRREARADVALARRRRGRARRPRGAALAVDPHAEEAARGRGALEHVAVQAEAASSLDPPRAQRCIRAVRSSPVFSTTRPGRLGVADQADRRPRDAAARSRPPGTPAPTRRTGPGCRSRNASRL